MVGIRSFPFWDGLFSGVILVSGRVNVTALIWNLETWHSQKTLLLPLGDPPMPGPWWDFGGFNFWRKKGPFTETNEISEISIHSLPWKKTARNSGVTNENTNFNAKSWLVDIWYIYILPPENERMSPQKGPFQISKGKFVGEYSLVFGSAYSNRRLTGAKFLAHKQFVNTT